MKSEEEPFDLTAHYVHQLESLWEQVSHLIEIGFLREEAVGQLYAPLLETIVQLDKCRTLIDEEIDEYERQIREKAKHQPGPDH